MKFKTANCASVYRDACHHVIDSPVGKIFVVASKSEVRAILLSINASILSVEQEKVLRNVPKGMNDRIEEVEKQLNEYFAGERREFDLTLATKRGTPFQNRAWSVLTQIPYGDVMSYGEQAVNMGTCKAAARAVGAANSKNPFAIVVPCHRVIGTSGHLVGFGAGLRTKLLLLKMEARFSGGRMKFKCA